MAVVEAIEQAPVNGETPVAADRAQNRPDRPKSLTAAGRCGQSRSSLRRHGSPEMPRSHGGSHMNRVFDRSAACPAVVATAARRCASCPLRVSRTARSTTGRSGAGRSRDGVSAETRPAQGRGRRAARRWPGRRPAPARATRRSPSPAAGSTRSARAAAREYVMAFDAATGKHAVGSAARPAASATIAAMARAARRPSTATASTRSAPAAT